MDLCWFLPCLNWPVTNNPMKGAGIISRPGSGGAEQDRPRLLSHNSPSPTPPAAPSHSDLFKLLASLFATVHTWGQRWPCVNLIFHSALIPVTQVKEVATWNAIFGSPAFCYAPLTANTSRLSQSRCLCGGRPPARGCLVSSGVLARLPRKPLLGQLGTHWLSEEHPIQELQFVPGFDSPHKGAQGTTQRRK